MISCTVDDIIIPEALAWVHYEVAIHKQNRWMLDQSQYVISYIYRDLGGVFETVKYARKQGKTVIDAAQRHI